MRSEVSSRGRLPTALASGSLAASRETLSSSRRLDMFPSVSSRRVLILDPHPGVARMLAAFARLRGYSPAVARDPADLLSLAPSVRPGIVLLGFDASGDVRPGELAASLRAESATAGATLVALLVMGLEIERGWAFDYWLHKPGVGPGLLALLPDVAAPLT
jgi:hypothetical protein